MSKNADVGIEGMGFRKTHQHTGRRISVTPENSSMQHLAYGRIVLNASNPAESFTTGDRETGLVCLAGQATPYGGRPRCNAGTI